MECAYYFASWNGITIKRNAFAQVYTFHLVWFSVAPAATGLRTARPCTWEDIDSRLLSTCKQWPYYKRDRRTRPRCRLGSKNPRWARVEFG